MQKREYQDLLNSKLTTEDGNFIFTFELPEKNRQPEKEADKKEKKRYTKARAKKAEEIKKEKRT